MLIFSFGFKKWHIRLPPFNLLTASVVNCPIKSSICGLLKKNERCSCRALEVYQFLASLNKIDMILIIFAHFCVANLCNNMQIAMNFDCVALLVLVVGRDTDY